ncbi:MAG: methionine--tRNA ligase [Candidatus Thermoplasmatota archaeon]
MKKIFIGVAWPYANGSLHLGHVAGSLLPPDIFSRYHRMKGNEVLMVSGSDEHGTPITITAEELGLTPKEVAEKYHEEHKECIAKLGIKFDLFFRTSHPLHKEVVKKIFLKLKEKGYIYERNVDVFYCIKCKRALPDRYVEGNCPKCSSKTKGDQCEECGATIETNELLEPRCKICSSVPIIKEAKHFFFKLSAFEEFLKKYMEDKVYWRDNVINFTNKWLKEGLKDRAITRELGWGVDVPIDGWEDKRIYVWFEAVVGYLSTSIEWAKRIGDEKKWLDFWKNKDTKHYYFLGKDNIPFHTIILPSILQGYDDELNLPYDVPANEYLSFGGEKFSKSKGIGIEVPDYLKKYEPDVLRYYLSINMPDTHDTDFTWEDFIRKNNDELIGTLGNLVNRVFVFAYKNFGTIPLEGGRDELDRELIERIEKTYRNVSEFIEKCRFKDGMKEIMSLAQFGNKYFDTRAPWSAIKENREKCAHYIHMCFRLIKAITFLLYPYLPFTTQKLWEMLGSEGNIENEKWEEALKMDLSNRKLSKPMLLFKKIEESVIESKLEIRVGKIIDVKEHPNADKLYVLHIDFGDDLRNIVAGIKNYPRDELIGKKILVLVNLLPANIRGVESNGMLLAAEKNKKLSLLVCDAERGAHVSLFGEKIEKNKSKIGINDFKKVLMKVGDVICSDDRLEIDFGDEKRVLKRVTNLPLKGEQVVCAFSNGKFGFLVCENGKFVTTDVKIDRGAIVC